MDEDKDEFFNSRRNFSNNPDYLNEKLQRLEKKIGLYKQIGAFFAGVVLSASVALISPIHIESSLPTASHPSTVQIGTPNPIVSPETFLKDISSALEGRSLQKAEQVIEDARNIKNLICTGETRNQAAAIISQIDSELNKPRSAIDSKFRRRLEDIRDFLAEWCKL